MSWSRRTGGRTFIMKHRLSWLWLCRHRRPPDAQEVSWQRPTGKFTASHYLAARNFVNGGIMRQSGGVNVMEWTPPPVGIAMCQGVGAFELPEGEDIHGRG